MRPSVLRSVLAVASVVLASTVWAVLPNNPPGTQKPPAVKASQFSLFPRVKEQDRPNSADYRRNRRRLEFVSRLESELGRKGVVQLPFDAAGREAAFAGTDRVLVVLVEFGGTDTFTWTLGTSKWDPLGKVITSEAVYDSKGALVVGDCSKIITETKQFTYTGPLHNAIARPPGATDDASDSIWTPDFSKSYYESIIFGNGYHFDYTRDDGSSVNVDFTGKSVRKYYEDQSAGRYTFGGDVYGWVQVPHSTWWYGTDSCPGRRAGGTGASWAGARPGAATARSLVVDALAAVRVAYPNLDWKQYDQDNDGIIDRLWIIHAGFGEEDSPTLLNRTTYGESALWSHSSGFSEPVEVAPGIKVNSYIMMPENSGISVLAHEFGHNLGAMDLYAYGDGDTSAGFWTLMSDNWVGYPVNFQPEALDPLHQDAFGWLDPYVITDSSREYVVTIGQASSFPGGKDVYRGVKIHLEPQRIPLPIKPKAGSYQWWGNDQNLANAAMTTKNPIAIPAGGATLSFDITYNIEDQWDFLWVQVSEDSGATWKTLTNAHTTCTHDEDWIGDENGFPADLCTAKIGGFTGKASYPAWAEETFSLEAFAGKSVLLRFWYMTDWASAEAGAFLDNIKVKAGEQVLFADDAESGDAAWTYRENWLRVDDTRPFDHYYYLQFRNVGTSGGYDSSLGDARWYFGPVNSGVLLWYSNPLYGDNEVGNHLYDYPGFGPKGRMLVVDANPEPYRSPVREAEGYHNEGANLSHRSLMRDAPFSLFPSVDFNYGTASYKGRPAVSLFSDANGYYPGAEYSSRGPGYDPPVSIWATKQWDASVVLPGRSTYGINAPAYKAGTAMFYGCYRLSGGKLSCSQVNEGNGLPYDGTSGNPGDLGLHYGWNFQITNQSEKTATVRIWNTRASCTLTCSATVPGVATANTEVTLTAQSSGCTGTATYDWTFGDGATSSGANATVKHTYATAGSYTWKVKVTVGSRSCESTGTILVRSGAAQSNVTWVPVAARLAGTGGSKWRTDVAVLNVGSQPAFATLVFHGAAGDRSKDALIGAGDQRIFTDVVGLFGVDDSGTLEVRSDAPVHVTSRTYTESSAGTFGQSYDGFTAGQGVASPGEVYLPQLTENATFRSNIQVTNTGTTAAQVKVTLYNGAGRNVSEYSATVQPGTRHQANRPFRLAGFNNIDAGYAKVAVQTGTGVIAYASVVDNNVASNDPTSQVGRAAPTAGQTTWWLPVAARSTGTGGTNWRTDVGVLNLGATAAQVQMRLHVTGAAPRTFPVAAGNQVILSDIVGQLGATGSGTLEVVSDVPVLVSSRTYNLTTANGTFGQEYDGVAAGGGLAAGQVGYLPQLSENAAYRSNVQLANTGTTQATVKVDLYDGTGAVVGSYSRTIDAGARHQANQPFASAGQHNLANGYARVTVETGAGVLVNGSVVDNTSTDPTTIPLKR
jgi:immune inhibitor A